jgi:hypothetical protein
VLWEIDRGPNKAKKNGHENDNKVNVKRLGELSELASLSERNAAIKWYVEQGESTRLETFEKQTELIRQSRRDGGIVMNPEFLYSMHLLAIKIIRRTEEALSRKRSVSIAEADEVARKRAKGFLQQKKVKSSVKFSQIRIQFYGVITHLRETQGYSWDDVAAYLQRYHNFICSRAYLQQSFNKITKGLVVDHDQ